VKSHVYDELQIMAAKIAFANLFKLFLLIIIWGSEANVIAIVIKIGIFNVATGKHLKSN